MFKSMLMALSGFAALLMLAAAPAQAQVCKVGIKFACTGNGNGTLSVSCRPGEAGAACCERYRRDVRRLCKRVGSGLASLQCNYLGTSAGVCGGSGGASGVEAGQVPYDPSQASEVRPGIPGAVQRPCARVAFNYVCRTGGRGSAGGACPPGRTTKECCRARLSLACGGESLVNFARSTCRCVGPDILRRR